MRLVPDQKPDEIADLFGKYLSAICPASVTLKVKYLHGGKPSATRTDSKGYQAVLKSIREVLGKDAIPVYSGGSIPVIAMFKEILGVDTVLLGFGLDDDNIHSPNEKFDLVNFYIGIETIAYFNKYFSE
jgi:acetylornithine deacetylase/succinyl-diaminopimelate desuccinylase-like protein